MEVYVIELSGTFFTCHSFFSCLLLKLRLFLHRLNQPIESQTFCDGRSEQLDPEVCKLC